MNPTQINRTVQALAETRRLLAMYEARKTFDLYQEQEKQERILECKEHIERLEKKLADAWAVVEAA